MYCPYDEASEDNPICFLFSGLQLQELVRSSPCQYLHYLILINNVLNVEELMLKCRLLVILQYLQSILAHI